MGIAGRRGLLVTRHATHTVERQAVLHERGHGVMRLSVVMGSKMPHRRVARGAFVFQFQLVLGVDQYFVAHLGPPKRIPGRVGHEGAAPVVRDVHVPAVGHGLRWEGLSGNAGKAVRVFAMATGALTAACKQGVGRIGQPTIRRAEFRGVVRSAVLVPMLRAVDCPHQPERQQCRSQSYPSNRFHVVQV